MVNWELSFRLFTIIMSEEKRVVFYSPQDLSAWWHLEKAFSVLNESKDSKQLTLEDYIEFYNIFLYTQNDVYLKKWDSNQKEFFQKKSKELFEKTAIFFQSIESKDILYHIDEIDKMYRYQKHYRELLNKYKVYERIPEILFSEILEKSPFQIHFILIYKSIVEKFAEEIRTFLISHEWSGDLLLDHIRNSSEEKKYFPISLTNEDKENIIDKYLENETEKLGNLELIEKLWDTSFLRLSPKIKLKAKRVYEERIKDFFEGNKNTFKFWYQVWLSKTQTEPIQVEKDTEWLPKISYSVDFFDTLDFESSPLAVFSSLFSYINKQWLIELVSKDSEISPMEWVFNHREINDYKVGTQFRSKEMLALLNLQILDTYLKKFRNLCIEDLINNFIKNYQTKTNNLKNIDFQINNYDIPYQERITNLIPKFDHFIKQYRCYVEEDTIDFELIDIDSRSVSYDLIPSKLKNKYFYENNDSLRNLLYVFYSDQSWLFFIEWLNTKYNNLYELLTNEKIKLANMHNYQQEQIKTLIKSDYLYLDHEDVIQIKDPLFTLILWELFREWVLSYYSYIEIVREKIREMANNWLLVWKSSLLSMQEVDYFNYYLNKSKFLNWPQIRNKNIHWYKYVSNDEAYTDYMVLLRLIILLLLKIDLEFKDFDLLDKENMPEI